MPVIRKRLFGVAADIPARHDIRQIRVAFVNIDVPVEC